MTVTALKALRKPGFHADGGGLYVRIRDTGGRSFVFVSTKGGKRRETVVGPVGDVTLAEAREARDRLRRGEPARATAPSISTFGDWADAYVAEHESGWRNAGHKRQWRETFKTHVKALRGLQLGAVDTAAVLDVLRPLWASHNETASRVRGRIERVLDAAKAKGLIASPWENPARWRGHLSHLLPPRRKLSARGHQAAMPYADVPDFVQQLRVRKATSARALEWLILGANRTGEVIGAKGKELDRTNRIWTVPAERMKMGFAHRIYLTDRMMAILEEMAVAGLGPEDYIFRGAKSDEPLSNMAMMALLRRMELGHLTVHGFRSAFRDFAGEETEHAESVAEAALAHSVGDSTVRAYRRGDSFDRRRRLMLDWEAFVAGGPVEKAGPAIEHVHAPSKPSGDAGITSGSIVATSRRRRRPNPNPYQITIFGDDTAAEPEVGPPA